MDCFLKPLEVTHLSSVKHAFVRLLAAIVHKPLLDPADVDFSRVKRVLVIRQHDMMGDFILATPVLRAIRNRFPDAHIGVLVQENFADILVHNPFVDEVLILWKTRKRWNPSSIGPLVSALFRKWDLAVVLNTVSHSLTSDILAGLSGSRIILGSSAKPIQGIEGNFLYDLQAPCQPGMRHQTERNLDIVRHIGADTTDLSEAVFLTESERQAAGVMLRELHAGSETPRIAMHIGAGKLKNRWPVDRFALLARELRDRLGASIVLCWGPQENDLAAEFQRLVGFETIRVPPGTLRALAAILSQCDMLLCNDTGIMHLGASVGLPLVAIFGPTDPVEWKPVGDNFVAIRGNDATVESVTVNEVAERALELIGKIRTL